MLALTRSPGRDVEQPRTNRDVWDSKPSPMGLTLKSQRTRCGSSKRQEPHRPQVSLSARHRHDGLLICPLLTFLPLVHTEVISRSGSAATSTSRGSNVVGVLWYGLTHRGGEGNPAEQERVIVDRLVRWATRDGGDGGGTAAAIRSVLDEYLPGR